MSEIIEEVKTHPRPPSAVHYTTIKDIASGVFTHSYAEITGSITKTHNEHDGDIHLHTTDGEHFIVCEIIPELPLKITSTGSYKIIGVVRQDKDHGWAEIHPVLKIEKI